MIIKPGDKIRVCEHYRDSSRVDSTWMKRFLEYGHFQQFGVEGDEVGTYPSVVYVNMDGEFKSAPVDLVTVCAVKLSAGDDRPNETKMDDLDELLKLVERGAELSQKKAFVVNVMETGTDPHKAIECGVRIGEKFRGAVFNAFESLLEQEGEK